MPGDAIGFPANNVQNLDFNLPHERSWQLRYNFNLVSLGAPGLTFMARYITSEGIDGSHYGGDAYSRYQTVTDGSRWSATSKWSTWCKVVRRKSLFFVWDNLHIAPTQVCSVSICRAWMKRGLRLSIPCLSKAPH
jgi:hypothetical protein